MTEAVLFDNLTCEEINESQDQLENEMLKTLQAAIKTSSWRSDECGQLKRSFNSSPQLLREKEPQDESEQLAQERQDAFEDEIATQVAREETNSFAKISRTIEEQASVHMEIKKKSEAEFSESEIKQIDLNQPMETETTSSSIEESQGKSCSLKSIHANLWSTPCEKVPETVNVPQFKP